MSDGSSQFQCNAKNSFPFEHIKPSAPDGRTFVCFNALTGDKGMWTATVGDALRKAGHGLLIWNFRGQPETEFDFAQTSESDIVSDAIALIRQEKPVRSIFVGLSIGGLFAIRAHEAGNGSEAEAIVLLNTLRRGGPRLDWINRAVLRAAEVGGPELIKDLYSPLLMNEEWQAENAKNFLQTAAYRPMISSDGTLMLLKAGVGANWDVDYGAIKVPVLSITGEQDRVFRDPGDIDTLYSKLPNAQRMELPDAGHMIPVERPQALAAALLDFAKSL